MFKLGQLVICVGDDADFHLLRKHCPEHAPFKGSVYTVGALIAKCPSCQEPHLWFEELPFLQSGYPGSWFKPCREGDFRLFLMRLFPDRPEQRMIG